MTKQSDPLAYEFSGLRLPRTDELTALPHEDPFRTDYLSAEQPGQTEVNGDYYSLDGSFHVRSDDAWAILSLQKYARKPRVIPGSNSRYEQMHTARLDGNRQFAEMTLLVTPKHRDNRNFGFLRTEPASQGSAVQISASLAKLASPNSQLPGPIIYSGTDELAAGTRNVYFTRIAQGEQAAHQLATLIAPLCLRDERDQVALLEMMEHQISEVGSTLSRA